MLCYNSGVFRLTKPKLPITPEQQWWVDSSFGRLARLLGAHRLLQGTQVLPAAAHSPAPYDRAEKGLRCIFHREATQRQVTPADVDVTLFASGAQLPREADAF